MLAISCVAAALQPLPLRGTAFLRSGPLRMMAGGEDEFYRRGIDLLQTSDKVTARQIVNVLGRWKSNADWNDSSGRKGKLDDLRSGDYYDDDLDA